MEQHAFVTNLIGRKVVVKRSHALASALFGEICAMRRVVLDVCDKYRFTVELDDGRLIDVEAADFRVVQSSFEATRAAIEDTRAAIEDTRADAEPEVESSSEEKVLILRFDEYGFGMYLDARPWRYHKDGNDIFGLLQAIVDKGITSVVVGGTLYDEDRERDFC